MASNEYDFYVKVGNDLQKIGGGDDSGGSIQHIKVNGVEQSIQDKTVDIDVPTKTSDLTNDSNFVQSSELEDYALKTEIPTKTSDLENDSNFVAESTLEDYALKTEVPTSTSQLTNDSNFITDSAVDSKISGATSPLSTRLTSAESSISSLDGRVSDVEEQVSTIESDIEQQSTDIADLRNDVDDIQEILPNSASSDNQLADQDFVNSSIATNTANFVGTFSSTSELPTTGITNNDYGFVTTTVEGVVTAYNRYKYVANVPEWKYEYTLNNSSFTSEQWAAINSGITSGKIDEIDNALQLLQSAIDSKVAKQSQTVLLKAGKREMYAVYYDVDGTPSEIRIGDDYFATPTQAVTIATQISANKVDKVAGKGLSANDYTDADKQAVTNIPTALNNKVDKVAGKQLSTNDFTTAYKTLLDELTVAKVEEYWNKY